MSRLAHGLSAAWYAMYNDTANVHPEKCIDMKKEAVIKVYDFYAPVYDLLFGLILNQGRKEVIELMNVQPHEKVLEVGIGTGLSLSYYPQHAQIFGIDISEKMLNKAKRRTTTQQMPHVVLSMMDAEIMAFAENTFDKIALMHVYSVTPHPKKLLTETQRVCKPEGDIFLLNHFSDTNVGWLKTKFLQAVERTIGFRLNCSMDDSHFCELSPHILQMTSTNIFGFWKIIHLKNRAEAYSAL
ncbi:methyltransferase domain-containing protein [candidate division KSB3 bacterium]|uniref:Methyltransferase domain-containing protein n=1 Tax=candidate division KSB3 bacterium TaxID=2044937 RepID=A0A9D5Q643_9BACT|nr:methyltransferase domain-containing protein [candidate division KSB3 bacterium]MBD3325320.1 methyltransferase domain-containing protein [candidate division KSB3 bacterium]